MALLNRSFFYLSLWKTVVYCHLLSRASYLEQKKTRNLTPPVCIPVPVALEVLHEPRLQGGPEVALLAHERAVHLGLVHRYHLQRLKKLIFNPK